MTKNKLMATVSGVFAGASGAIALERILAFVDVRSIEIQAKLAERLTENQNLYDIISSAQNEAFVNHSYTLFNGLFCAGVAGYFAVQAIYNATRQEKKE